MSHGACVAPVRAAQEAIPHLSQSDPPPFQQRPVLLYTTLDASTSTIWQASAAEPGSARHLTTVQHRKGYGLKAQLSPDGKRVAYLSLAPDAGDPSTQAGLWVLDLAGAGRRRLGEGFDLLGMPAWSPDGRRVAVRRAASLEEQSLVAVDVESGAPRRLAMARPVEGMYAIGWSADGTHFYYATLARSGTDVHRLDVATGTELPVLHASDGIAHDFKLSPSGGTLLYNDFIPDSPARYRVLTLDLAAGEHRVLLEDARPAIGPVWRPDGPVVTRGSDPQNARLRGGLESLSVDALLLSSPPRQDGRGEVLPRLTDAPRGSFLAPLAWSPDGRYLAARQLFGQSADRVEGERLVVIPAVPGAPTAVAAQEYAEFVGWLP